LTGSPGPRAASLDEGGRETAAGHGWTGLRAETHGGPGRPSRTRYVPLGAPNGALIQTPGSSSHGNHPWRACRNILHGSAGEGPPSRLVWQLGEDLQVLLEPHPPPPPPPPRQPPVSSASPENAWRRQGGGSPITTLGSQLLLPANRRCGPARPAAVLTPSRTLPSRKAARTLRPAMRRISLDSEESGCLSPVRLAVRTARNSQPRRGIL
jgi:hypothetical protein